MTRFLSPVFQNAARFDNRFVKADFSCPSRERPARRLCPARCNAPTSLFERDRNFRVDNVFVELFRDFVGDLFDRFAADKNAFANQRIGNFRRRRNGDAGFAVIGTLPENFDGNNVVRSEPVFVQIIVVIRQNRGFFFRRRFLTFVVRRRLSAFQSARFSFLWKPAIYLRF